MNKETFMNSEAKRYLISTALTFVSVFLGVILLNVETISLTKEALLSLALTGFRVALKATLEYLIPYIISLIKK